jgi:proton-translocating NAD(P)+ transhydrogenase subunit alpha
MAVSVGVLRETAPGEGRVAIVPEVVPRLRGLGLRVLVEAGAGAGAWAPDSAYLEAGAEVVDAAGARAARVLLCVRPPDQRVLDGLRPEQVLVGLLDPLGGPGLVTACARHGVTSLSLDLLPRTLSRAQPMDALSSQANIAGYKAVLVAANAYGRYFPMLMTAAGTARPARVLVLGAGVAGLSALGTARRLGAVVTGYDIRPETRGEVESVGASFLDLAGVGQAGGEGGYARALTGEERAVQQAALQQRIGEFDVVITTAQVPGRRPPLLVTEEALKGMRPGSVVVDLAAGASGGNVQGSRPGVQTIAADQVIVIGAGNLPAAMAAGVSAAYARNISALLAQVVREGELRLDPADEIVAAITVTRAGAVVAPAVRATPAAPAPAAPAPASPDPASPDPASPDPASPDPAGPKPAPGGEAGPQAAPGGEAGR